MTSVPGLGVGSGNYGADAGDRERGGRRKRLAGLAGSIYRAGAVAASEIRESYNQTRVREIDTSESSKITIPGSFPDVAIVTKGNEQMVLFPSYAKRHVRGQPWQFEKPGGPPDASGVEMSEQEYWRYEWARQEDEKAVVDVDVRGWIYNPHKGPMTRRNRILIGLARQLSGIPAPSAAQQNAADQSFLGIHQQHEEEREQQRIAQEAREIERRGQAEKEAAQQGGYSEPPNGQQSEDEGDRQSSNWQSRNQSPSAPSSPRLVARTNTSGSTTSTTAAGAVASSGTGLTDAELAVANANLMARIGPFMTTPMVEVPITLFFYNDSQSQSRTVQTDDSGHFIIRAALDFVPTHVRVLATEDISCTEPIEITEPSGVSLISDIDDTIKRSSIALGAKEIFRNTFIRELDELTVDGVREWYNRLHNDLGVHIHYCSNSPWQLYHVLATYFKLAGLPPGSLHLKRYNGMLQGIFEPVAERKKGTLEKILHDFPERRFLLVGDSGEADLEVYTELTVANPGRIVGIFIRDVTTPEEARFFDSDYNAGTTAGRKPNTMSRSGRGLGKDESSDRPVLPPRMATTANIDTSVTDDLIDLSEEPMAFSSVDSAQRWSTPRSETASSEAQGRKPPPPKPSKPRSLKSSPSVSTRSSDPDLTGLQNAKKAPPPPQPRKATSLKDSGSQVHSSSSSSSDRIQDRNETQPIKPNSSGFSARNLAPPPPLPPPRRKGTSSSSNRPASNLQRRRTGDWDSDLLEPLPPPSYASGSYGANDPPKRTATPTGSRYGNGSSATITDNAAQQQQQPINKRLDLWRRRLERAQDTLDRAGVPLYTWRRGEDVMAEAVGIVRNTLKELGVDEKSGKKR